MTANKLQEAISLIRSGDKEIGQKLLTEILNAEPGNETAWLWMAALMSGEKRKFCLETQIFEVSEKYYPKSELLGYRIPK